MSLLTPQACANKKGTPEKGAEEILVDSYTMRVSGYRQTVTVKCTPQEMSAFLDDPKKPSAFAMQGVDLSDERTDRPDGIGSYAPLSINMMGIKVPGILISIKTIRDRLLWTTWDNPYIFAVQRWKSQPVEEGLRTTLNNFNEVPDSGTMGVLGRVAEAVDVEKTILSGVDETLAGIQAHFDPEVDKEELLKVGLRGERYEELLQVHEATLKVKGGLREVTAKVNDPDSCILGYIGSDCDCLYGEAASGEEVLYCPCSANIGGEETRLDAFVVERRSKRKYMRRVYFLLNDRAGYVELMAEQKIFGTRLGLKYVSEIPDAKSDSGLDHLLFLSEVPIRIKECARMAHLAAGEN